MWKVKPGVSATEAEESANTVRAALQELGEERQRQDEALGETERNLLGQRRNRPFVRLVQDLQMMMIGPAWLLSVLYRRMGIPI